MRRITPAILPATHPTSTRAPAQSGVRGGAARPAGPPEALAPGPETAASLPTGKFKLTTPLKLVYLLWVVLLMDPHVWLARFGLGPLLKTPLVVFALLAFYTFTRPKPHEWARYMLGFMLVCVAAMPFAYNRGHADVVVKQLIVYYFFTIGTLNFVRTPRQALPIIGILLFQNAWWGFHGAIMGRVPWHSTNANFDGFGPQMVIGLAVCYYFGMAARKPRVKLFATVLAAVCIIGIITSFARGAVLSAGLVALILWIRSPRKGRTTLAAVVGGIILVISVQVIFPDGSFWDEMASSFTEGTEEGTGNDRKVLWTAAFKVFMARPIVGTAPENFGPYAADFFKVGEVGGEYRENPRRLYERQLHSIFFQILAETGLLGSLCYLLMIADFIVKNRQMQSVNFGRAWRAADRSFELKPLALGLESALIAYLASGFFYDQLYVPWFFWIMAANLMLFQVSRANLRTNPVQTSRRFG